MQVKEKETYKTIIFENYVVRVPERLTRDELYKNRSSGLPGKLILSQRKGLWEVLFF